MHGRRARAATVAERALPARDVHRRAAATCACARAAPWRGPLRARWSDPWHPAGATAGAALGGARARGGARRARRLCVHVPLDEAVRTSKVLAEQSSRRQHARLSGRVAGIAHRYQCVSITPCKKKKKKVRPQAADGRDGRVRGIWLEHPPGGRAGAAREQAALARVCAAEREMGCGAQRRRDTGGRWQCLGTDSAPRTRACMRFDSSQLVFVAHALSRDARHRRGPYQPRCSRTPAPGGALCPWLLSACACTAPSALCAFTAAPRAAVCCERACARAVFLCCVGTALQLPAAGYVGFVVLRQLRGRLGGRIRVLLLRQRRQRCRGAPRERLGRRGPRAGL